MHQKNVASTRSSTPAVGAMEWVDASSFDPARCARPERRTRRIEPGPPGFITTNAAFTTMNAALVLVSEVPHPEGHTMLSNL